jgi:hypothetical protein
MLKKGVNTIQMSQSEWEVQKNTLIGQNLILKHLLLTIKKYFLTSPGVDFLEK